MMCLSIVYKGRKKRDSLSKLPDMIVCWKVVRKQGNQHVRKYLSEYRHNGSCLSFLSGWNKTESKWSISDGYSIAFHAFLKKDDAKSWMFRDKVLHVVKCKTKKKDIVGIGRQSSRLCLVTKRIWIPKPKKKSEKAIEKIMAKRREAKRRMGVPERIPK